MLSMGETVKSVLVETVASSLHHARVLKNMGATDLSPHGLNTAAVSHRAADSQPTT